MEGYGRQFPKKTWHENEKMENTCGDEMRRVTSILNVRRVLASVLITKFNLV